MRRRGPRPTPRPTPRPPSRRSFARVIPNATVEKIKDAMRVEEVVGDYVNLKRSGSSYKGLCPLHGEKTPSFYVTPAKGIFKCFGCGEGGDAISFVQLHDGLTYVEALKHIARKYNIPVEETAVSDEVRQENQRAAALQLVNDYARTFYREQLTTTEGGRAVGLSYFRQRGYTDATVAKFELGFAPADGRALRAAAEAAGYRLDYLRDLGLTTKDGARDFLRDRVVFPIHGYSGKVVAFAGRVLRSDTKAPKYLNSPETELYHKSKVLYGLHLARTAIRREDHALIVEGYADVIALHQAGVENVVATSGTALTAGHIRLVKRLTERVVFLYDGDKAGIKAALRGLDLVLAEGMEVRLVLLPDGHDPDSYVKEHGGQAFRDYVAANSKDFIAYKSDLVLAQAADDPIERARLVQDVLASVAVIPDAILRGEYVRATAARFAIDEAVLVQQLNRNLDGRYREEQRKQRAAARDDTSAIAAEAAAAPTREESLAAKPQPRQGATAQLDDGYRERDIARILVRFGEEVFDRETGTTVGAYLCAGMEEVLDAFDDAVCAQVANDFHQRLQRGETVGTDYWAGHASEEVRKFSAEALTEVYTYSEGWWERFEITLTTQRMPDENFLPTAKRSILRFKLAKLLRKMDETVERMGAAQRAGDEKTVARLNRLFVRMTAVKLQLSGELGSVVLR